MEIRLDLGLVHWCFHALCKSIGMETIASAASPSITVFPSIPIA